MGFKRIRIFLEMIKFEHTIFALPFAYLGALMAAGPAPYGRAGLPTKLQIFWITLVMVGARTFAMSANRLIDRKIDAKNPRTAGRALPKKLLSVTEVAIYMIFSAAVYLYAVYQLSPLAKMLWPVALIALTGYSYLKRFFPLANFGLGLCLALAPLGAWMAVTNTVTLPIIFISLGVFCWASGFDIIYSCQDYDVDVSQNLYSIPVTFGIKKALVITRFLHVFAVLFFALAGYYANLGMMYYFGLSIASVLLIYENSVVKDDDLSCLDQAFFTSNSFFSVILTFFALIEILKLGI